MKLNREPSIPDWREFSRRMDLIGGPDGPPLTPLITDLNERFAGSMYEQLWRIGCYATTYTLGGGSVLWTEFAQPPTEAKLCKEWDRIAFKRERSQPLRGPSPKYVVQCLNSYWDWMERFETGRDFEETWGSLDAVWSMGRYINIKIIHLLYETGLITEDMPDIRPYSGWGPRNGLLFIYPESMHKPKSQAKVYIEQAHYLSRRAKEAIEPTTWYKVQVLLCNYHQSLTRNGLFPGRHHDRELAAFLKAGNVDFDLYGLRKRLFPHECLGELQGWVKREDLDGIQDYIWSDVLYNYNATTDLRKPVKR